TFSTLVTNTGSTSSFSAGGVQSDSRQVVDQQGLIQGSGVGTDLAITGNGMFAVNTDSDGSGESLYTRAGSFRGDERGFFKNSSGFYLLAWPLDSEGRLPGETVNLNTTSNALIDSLEAVNIRSLGGVATATTTVDFGINL